MNRSGLLVILVFFGASALADTSHTIILEYSEFGPPSLAWDTIGHDWWQWENHGDSRPKTYDIKVVVFRGIALNEVKQLYPVIPRKNQDYRYMEYSEAIQYLSKSIAEVGETIPKLSARLEQTRQRILNAFKK